MTNLLAWGPRSGQPEERPGARELPQPLPGHAGLWLDRMLDQAWSEHDKEWPARRRLYQAAVDSLTPGSRAEDDPPALQVYRPLFERWRQAVTQTSSGIYRRVLHLEACSRLLLHPASSESVTEGALLLHHTYGVPYLPGSALKGVTRVRLLAAARHEPDRTRREQLEGWAEGLLGFVRQGGPGRIGEEGGGSSQAKTQGALVDFLDALWMPPQGAVRGGEPARPLALDVVTPHHPRYYTVGEGDRQAPTDGDSPTPVLRLSVAPGAQFFAVVEAPADLQAWLDWLVDAVLLPALAEDGLGAWTSSGYGRLGAVGGRAQEPPPEPEEWQGAQVFWVSNKREIRAVLDDRRQAFARNAEADEILSALPEESRKRLKDSKKREARLETQVLPEGTSWKITGLRPPSPS